MWVAVVADLAVAARVAADSCNRYPNGEAQRTTRCLLREYTLYISCMKTSQPAPAADRPAGRAASHESNRSRLAWAAVGAFVLAVAVGGVYGRVLHAPFIFDDHATIENNPSIVRLFPLVAPGRHGGPFNPPKNLPTSARPLVNLSLAINYHFGGLNTAGYHAFSFGLHWLTALLLWAIVRRTLLLDCFGGRFEHAAGSLSFLAALLWALHPLNTESVAYMTQRTEVMMGFFYLAVFYAGLRYWEAKTNNARTAWLAVATLAGVLGMISKEMMASAIAMVLLYERTFITGSFLKALRASWPLYVGLALGWLPIFVINANGPRTPLAGFHLGIPAHVWWYTQTVVFALFLKLTFWPWPLVIHYEIPYLETLFAAWSWVLVVVAYCVATIVLVWRRTSAGFVATCFVAVLSPTLLIPLPGETMAERRMYMPLAAIIPFFIAGVYALVQEFERKRERSRGPREVAILATGIGAVVIATIFGMVSFRRLAAYRDEFSIWQDAALYQPHDPLIQINLGTSLAHNGLHREAIVYFEQALKLDPKHSHAHYNLARALVETGRGAEALPHYEQAVQADPKFADAQYNYALALRNAGRIAAAIEHFEAAIECRPDFAAAHNNLAATLASVERYADAAPHFEEAVKLEPDAQTYFNLAMTVVELGRVSDAIGYLQEAVKLTPSLEGYINLAAFCAAAERRAEAIAASQKAISLARETGQDGLAVELEARLATYRARTSGQ